MSSEAVIEKQHTCEGDSVPAVKVIGDVSVAAGEAPEWSKREVSLTWWAFGAFIFNLQHRKMG